MFKIGKTPILPFKNGVLQIAHFCVDFSLDRKSERIERKFWTQNPTLSAQTQVEEEGYQISKSSIMVVDLTSRPYFVGNLPVPEFQAQKGQTNILTLTEGIVGPIVPQFPLNITTILDLPKVCNYL